MKQFFTACLLLISNFVLAQSSVLIDTNLTEQKIGKSIFYLEDLQKEFSFDDILSEQVQAKFVKSEKEAPFFDYQNATFWLKFKLKNITTNNKQFYLLIDYPLLYKIRLFKPVNNRYSISYSGDGYPFDKREIKTSTNLFELNLQAGEQKTYYVSVESDGDVVNLPISILTKEKMIENQSKTDVFLGFFYGILILIIVINLFYYFNLRDKAYLTYVAYVTLLGLFIFTRDGYAFQFLWSDFPVWSNISVPFLSLTAGAVILYMMMQVLEIKRNTPILHSVVRVSVLALFLFVLPVLFIRAYYPFIVKFGNILAIYGIIISLIVIIISLRRKLFFAKYFIAARLFLIFGAFSVIMKNAGIGGIFEFEHSMKLGIGMEVVILAYGLSVRFQKLLQKSKQDAIDNLQKINELTKFSKIRLEEQVQQRTAELQSRNDELKAANTEIFQQKEEIQTTVDNLETASEKILLQKSELESNHKHITDSLAAAKRIQKAVLSNQKLFETHFNNYFIYFKPRDVVSGDFYWIKKVEAHLVFAAADSTGHGIPGAFLSLLGISFLNEIVGREHITETGQVLNHLRKHMKAALEKVDTEKQAAEGLDIALCAIDLATLELQFSGAYNPIYIIRNRHLIHLKGNRQPIGYYRKEHPFVTQRFQLEKNDIIYLFSDGYIDQFDWRNEKFKTRRFKQLLLRIHDKDFAEQKEIIDKTFHTWKGEIQQVDDVLLMAVQV